MPEKPLPIVWYLDDSDLPDGPDRARQIEQIASAIAAWEKDGSQSLNVLRKTIDKIVNP